MNRTRLTAKTQKQHRNDLIKKQKDRCYLCGLDFNQIKDRERHLDHSHDDGHCRTMLCSVCNSQEGKTKNKVNMVLKYSKSKGRKNEMTPSDYLRLIADYWERNFDDQPIHDTFKRDQVKRFGRLTAKQQIKLLTENDIEPAKNSALRAKQAGKLLKDGKIWL